MPLRPSLGAALLLATVSVQVDPSPIRQTSVLDQHFLITWYGNPHSARMGILGEQSEPVRAKALRDQAAAYAGLTPKSVMMAYHLVAVVAQCTPGRDGKWRRRESPEFIQALLADARRNGFKLILDVQPGRSSVAEEMRELRAFLAEPDVYLALDPEFAMAECEVPGRQIGQLTAADVNVALEALEAAIAAHRLPPKVLVVHQFRLDMLPDKHRIRESPNVDVVLNMDGFGTQSLKRASYRTVMRQGALEFAGIKLFYRQDTGLFNPAQVLGLVPQPSVVIYQ